MDSKITFGVWLKRRRRQLDMTQKGLAFQAGCSVGTIRKIEADERRPSRQLATLLAQHLDISPELLESFIAFARGEAYTADISFPILDPVDGQSVDIPAPPRQPSPPETPLQPVENNLPLETTPFVGREPELATLDDLFTNLDSRLVTLVGPGGIGKTRLALAYAEQLVDQSQYPNGVFFVNLAPLPDTERMIFAMAEVLNLRIQGGPRKKLSPKEQLLGYLRDRRLFLLLDNFEHLLSPAHPQNTEAEVDGATLVAEILQYAPNIRILVTSRERLNLHMEQLFAIDGLAYPDWETAAPEAGGEDVAEYTAVQLFLQAAQRSQQDFSLETREELMALTHICHLVGGMPLALEMAASWVDTLSLMDIAAELQHGIDILETELRDVPLRQRSIRATFDYSWRKLDEREQSVFAQLSIFCGGFTRPAAQAVTGATLQQLSRLVNKSFIQFNKQRDRYQIHDLLRQYGADRLSLDSELLEVVYERHSSFYSQFLGEFTVDLKSDRQAQAISAIKADIENIRLAWNQALRLQDLEAIDISLEALYRFAQHSHYGSQGVNDLERAVAMLRNGNASEKREVVLGRLLAVLGFYSHISSSGQVDRAKELANESLDILQRLGAREETYMPLSILAFYQESLEESYQLLQDSLAVARDTSDQWAIADALLHTGDKAHAAGEYERAAQGYQEAVQQFRKNGDMSGVGASLHKLSLVAINRGRYDEALTIAQEIMPLVRDFIPIHSYRALGYALIALEAYEEAQAQFQQALSFIGEPDHNTRDLLFGLGSAAFGVGEYARAAQQYQESLAEALEVDDLAYVAHNHDALGRLNLAQGNDIPAKEHLQAALEASISSGQPPLILDCLATIAELFIGEGDLEYAALLAMLITNHPASQAKVKERGAQLLALLEAQLSANDLANIRQRIQKIGLDAVVAQLLVDLKTP